MLTMLVRRLVSGDRCGRVNPLGRVAMVLGWVDDVRERPEFWRQQRAKGGIEHEMVPNTSSGTDRVRGLDEHKLMETCKKCSGF